MIVIGLPNASAAPYPHKRSAPGSRPRSPGHDPPVELRGDDGVVGRLDDCLETREVTRLGPEAAIEHRCHDGERQDEKGWTCHGRGTEVSDGDGRSEVDRSEAAVKCAAAMPV